MFKLVDTYRYHWPVTVRTPDPENPGKLREDTFQIEFEALPTDKVDEAFAEIQKQHPEGLNQQQAAFLMQRARNWRDVADEHGNPVPFSAEIFGQALQQPWVRKACWEAYVASVQGEEVRLGN